MEPANIFQSNINFPVKINEHTTCQIKYFTGNMMDSAIMIIGDINKDKIRHLTALCGSEGALM